MITKTERKSLSARDFSDDNIEILKKYFQSNVIPPEVKSRYRKKFVENYENFILEGNDIYYKPLHLKVVPESQKEMVLKKIYQNPDEGLGLGIASFYDFVKSKYLNFTRKYVGDFLKQQTPYQLTTSQRKPVNRPIVAKYPNNRWAIDLIDMSSYEDKGYKYIMTVIDYFTKKGFAEPLRSKSEIETVAAFERLCDRLDTQPVILQSDNGTEFKNKEMKAFCEQEGIKQVFTTSYTPTGNALIENFNGKLWHIMHDHFARTQSKKWVDDLQHFVNNKNNRTHAITKKMPEAVWVPGTSRELETPELKDIQKRLIKKAKRDVQANENQELEKGDYVRVSNASLSTKIRAAIKGHKAKYIPIKFSVKIYRIKKVHQPKENQEGMRKNTYTIEEEVYDKQLGTSRWQIVTTERRKNDAAVRVRKAQRFFATELQKVSDDQDNAMSVDTMNKLNLVGVNYVEAEEEKKKHEKQKEQNEKAKNLRDEQRIIDKEEEEKLMANMESLPQPVKKKIIKEKKKTETTLLNTAPAREKRATVITKELQAFKEQLQKGKAKKK